MERKRVLVLSLKSQWFEMIKSGEKREEYRELNAYWLSRFCHIKKYKAQAILRAQAVLLEPKTIICSFNSVLKDIPIEQYIYLLLEQNFDYEEIEFTLGYPSKDDSERRMIKKIKSIRIDEGKEEWGAEKGKKYFVISF